jgi:hypothetical protein
MSSNNPENTNYKFIIAHSLLFDLQQIEESRADLHWSHANANFDLISSLAG